MTRKRRRSAAPSAASVAKSTDRLTRSRLFALFGVVLMLGTAAVLTVRRVSPRPAAALAPLPPPVATFADTNLVAADFAGSEACAECHRAQYDMWARSTHAAAGGSPTPQRVIARFNGPDIRFRDAVVTPSAAGGLYTFTIRQSNRADRVLRVDGVIGGGHMQGGGTQGFVTRMDDGTWRFLPFDFSRHSDTWFCNTIGRGNKGWVPITPALSLAECVDWPPVRTLGDERRFSNCASCHGSQISVTADTAAHGYRTTFTALDINCESCHGPGTRHVALVRDRGAIASGNIGMASLATLSKDASLGVCWQCHALKDQLRRGFVSGKPLEAFYSLLSPQLGDEAYLPDGRVRTFAYQQGHLYSACYVNGGMTCTSCHDPHSQGYRTVSGEALSGRVDDRQCTGCHASKAVNATAHTKHASNSEGSRCTSCHMPYLQEPELGGAIQYRRSDHVIPVPRPVTDSARGVISACKGCHADKSEGVLDGQVRAWYGELKPVAHAVDALTRARGMRDRGAIAKLILVPEEPHTAALYAGLAWFVDSQLEPDMPRIERDVVRRLTSLATHADVDMRAMALASLHYAAGREPSVRRTLATALARAGASEIALRDRWVVLLGYLADKARNGGNAATAISVYRKALEIEPENPRLHLNLGLAEAATGDMAGAVASYRRSLELDAVQPLALVNLGIALDQQGARVAAIDTYKRAIALYSRDALAHFNLANAYLRAGVLDSAALSYDAATRADPSLAIAHFYRARIALSQRDAPRALREIEAGLEFDPQNAEALQMRDQLRR